MSDIEPIDMLRRQAPAGDAGLPVGQNSGQNLSQNSGQISGRTASAGHGGGEQRKPVFFDRRELDAILRVYGQQVAAGEWRDYAIDANPVEATFSIYRRTAEMPIYRVIKAPKDARRQGAYRIISATGMILKRGQDLAQVLKIFNKRRLSLVGT